MKFKFEKLICVEVGSLKSGDGSRCSMEYLSSKVKEKTEKLSLSMTECVLDFIIHRFKVIKFKFNLWSYNGVVLYSWSTTSMHSI